MNDADLSLAEESSSDGSFDENMSRLELRLKWLKRRRRFSYISGVLLFALFCIMIIGLFIRKPVVAIKPGDAQDAADFLTVEGFDTFPNDGEVYLTTALVQQNPSLWEFYWLRYIDNDIELIPEEEFFPGQSE